MTADRVTTSYFIICKILPKGADAHTNAKERREVRREGMFDQPHNGKDPPTLFVFTRRLFQESMPSQ